MTYGVFRTITTSAGNRDKVADLIIRSREHMKGCTSFVIGYDLHDPNLLWTSQCWESAEAAEAFVKIPEVAANLREGMTMIEKMPIEASVTPVWVLNHGN